MKLPNDYFERVYAGVLGKIIGVYLGRPFEGWRYDRILAELGEIWYYVHEKLDKPLIVTDDDITGTFTFLRALPDHGNSRDITAEQIGNTWLNHIIENKSILWWGGMGNSTEHTAFLRLLSGIPAPRSGCMALNSKVVAEQIGAQIFIDGWAMVAPNDPALAVELAGKAGSVSHDGEALYGAQVLAAMEAAAFGESDLNTLLEIGLGFIPQDSTIAKMIAELRALREQEDDWRKAFAWLQQNYGYDKFGGGCHMVPNHGLMILSLLWGDDDFQKTQMICNTCGWDTDCNAGNVGCLMGIKNGLACLEQGPDWRGPVADRLYLPTADGGRAISDAVIETLHIVNIGRALQGLPALAPKDGARFHFSLPGAVQGFIAEAELDSAGTLAVENAASPFADGERCLSLRYHHLAVGRAARAATAVFIPPQALQMPGYDLTASPTLYPGQTVEAVVMADFDNIAPIKVALYYRAYDEAGIRLNRQTATVQVLAAGENAVLRWTIEQAQYQPIAEIGLEITGENGASGRLWVDRLGWSGVPSVNLIDAESRGSLTAKRPWVNALDGELTNWGEPLRLNQNRSRGMAIQGTQDWKGYVVSAEMEPHFCKAWGLAAHVQGLRRYYALLAYPQEQKLRLVKMLDTETVLAEIPYELCFDQVYTLALAVADGNIQAWVDGELALETADTSLLNGAVGLVVTEGRVGVHRVTIQPA